MSASTFRITAHADGPSTVRIVDMASGVDIADRVLAVDIRMRPGELVTATLKVFAELDIEGVTLESLESLKIQKEEPHGND